MSRAQNANIQLPLCLESAAVFERPLILDDSVDLTETAGLDYAEVCPDGLLANSGALFSMSTFEKVPQGDVLDYHASSLNDPSSYASFAQPPYATHLLLPSALSEDNDQLHYVTSSDLSGSNDPYDENRSAFFDPRLRQGLEITSYTPADGTKGTRVYVNVRTFHDLLSPPALSIFLSFGSKRIECLIEQIPSSHVELKQYVLSSEVPSFPSTGHHSFTVPLHLVMEGAGGSTSAPQVVEVGAFTYLGPPATSAAQDLTRKRKLSSSPDDILNPAKRLSGTGLRAQDANAEYAYHAGATSPYSPFLPTPTSSGLYQQRYSQGNSPRSYGHQYSTSTASQASIKAPSPHTPSYSPSMSTVKKTPRSPGLGVTPAGRSSGSVSGDKAPSLVRTSTIPSFNEPAGSSSSMPSFNPYAIYPQKATLKLNGNLDVMAETWTRDEWDSKRRLVQFTRRQVGSSIHADFKPISQEERQQNMICISCIWWEEKQECFVTSVDTIFLLEALVAVRFTVEEKNRIRRNLEGFRPLTVSKVKSDSEDFFKLIMGFPNPKPRNIEKDVKVFPWKILAHALKKIISKYVCVIV
ncbi:putative transcriptional regulator medusa [Phaeomoniella chlamydospora]|uniref:Putative transcriptional regulator medusa n=1 Tax=Phaeomoniella chlamydospora TaxID=158046 RepID=A0A0G2EHN5_PHACM|nr:putative transcriptional regulator medusa [Phaeomoniella chlamydospora]